jgi:hypothetical protein
MNRRGDERGLQALLLNFGGWRIMRQLHDGVGEALQHGEAIFDGKSQHPADQRNIDAVVGIARRRGIAISQHSWKLSRAGR